MKSTRKGEWWFKHRVCRTRWKQENAGIGEPIWHWQEIVVKVRKDGLRRTFRLKSGLDNAKEREVGEFGFPATGQATYFIPWNRAVPLLDSEIFWRTSRNVAISSFHWNCQVLIVIFGYLSKHSISQNYALHITKCFYFTKAATFANMPSTDSCADPTALTSILSSINALPHHIPPPFSVWPFWPLLVRHTAFPTLEQKQSGITTKHTIFYLCM